MTTDRNCKITRRLPDNMNKCGEGRLCLKEIMEEKNISMNQLSFRAEMQRTQLRNYRDNKIQRLDIDILKRLCYILNCDLHDLIEYHPPEQIKDPPHTDSAQ